MQCRVDTVCSEEVSQAPTPSLEGLSPQPKTRRKEDIKVFEGTALA